MSAEEVSREDFDAYRDELMEAIRSGRKLRRPFAIQPRLDAVFSPAWEADWLKLTVFYNCAVRARPARTYAQLIRLRDICSQKGRDEQFEAFFSDLNAFMYPEALTFHGYSNTFAAQDTQSMARSVGDILRPLEALGYPFFLYAGALLGLVRDGTYIAHDDDIDLAVFLGECTDEDAAAKWQDYKVALCAAGLAEYGETSNNPAVFKVVNELNITVDLFPAWTTSGKFSVYPYSFHAMAAEDVLPLKTDVQKTQGMFGDYEILLPADPEKLLVSSYGANWRVPDPLFRFNWRRAQKKFNAICTQPYC